MVGMRCGEAINEMWGLQLVAAIPLLRMRSLDSIPALDHVCFEGDGSRAAVKFEEEAAGVAENATRLIASP